MITINTEDYRRAKKRFFARKTIYISGVGIDVEKIYNMKTDRKAKRKESGMDGRRIKLLGFRDDILELCKSADLFVLPSLQEGLRVVKQKKRIANQALLKKIDIFNVNQMMKKADQF